MAKNTTGNKATGNTAPRVLFCEWRFRRHL